MQQTAIRVLIADDHTLVHVGLSGMLDAFPDLILVGQALNGVQAVELCESTMPQVVLMDLVMPYKDGITATREIVARYPTIRVLALTSFSDTLNVREAMQAGAVGYLLKNISADDLADAIRSAHAGRITLAPEAMQAMLEPQQPQPPTFNLTPRERMVLACLVKGHSNVEIAHQLTISPFTVKTHVSAILTKLGVNSRAEAVALTFQHNLAYLA